MKELPEDYFCPNCNAKAVKDMVYRMRADGMPELLVVNMALTILAEAKYPENLLRQVGEWSERYAETQGLTEEERDKMKLIKWQTWAKADKP